VEEGLLANRTVESKKQEQPKLTLSSSFQPPSLIPLTTTTTSQTTPSPASPLQNPPDQPRPVLSLYVKARVLGHKRAKRNSRPNTTLVQIEGVENKEAAQFYLGKVGTSCKRVWGFAVQRGERGWEGKARVNSGEDRVAVRRRYISGMTSKLDIRDTRPTHKTTGQLVLTRRHPIMGSCQKRRGMAKDVFVYIISTSSKSDG